MAEYEPTIGYNNRDDDPLGRTIGYGDGPPGSGSAEFGPGETIPLKGTEYRVVSVISGVTQSGEAVVYRVEDPSGKIRALKLYYPFPNPADEPNNEALRRIKGISNPEILPLFEYGTGKDKYLGKHCFEISRFAEGGDLLSIPEDRFRKKYSTEFLIREVIPQICGGIRALHENKIYHGDLKPQNVFYLDEKQTDLVIGDYGSAKTWSKSSHKSLAFTFLAKGTSFYLAPEQARGVMSEKNDYYSLGMILLHLLYPDLVNQDTLVSIIERQFAQKPIIDFDSRFGRLNNLIAGLTLQEIATRWGREEVERWLSGEDPPVAYGGVPPIKLGGQTLHNPEELAVYMAESRDWYDELIEDRQGFSMLLDWVARLQDLPHKREFESLVAYYRKDGRATVERAVKRYFKPSSPIFLAEESFDLFRGDDPVVVVEAFFKKLDAVWEKFTLDHLRAVILDLEYALRHFLKVSGEETRARVRLLLEKIAAALGLQPDMTPLLTYVFHRKTDYAGLVSMLNAFLPGRRLRNGEGAPIDTKEKLGLFIARDQSRFTDERYGSDLNALAGEFGIGDFKQLSLRECVYRCLEKHAAVALELTEVRLFSPDLDTPARYVVDFTRHYSLKEYLEGQGINFGDTRPEADEQQNKKNKKNKKTKNEKRSDTVRQECRLDLEDGDEQEMLRAFWDLYRQRYQGPDAPSVTEKGRASFGYRLLPALQAQREKRRGAEKARRREAVKRVVKATVGVPLTILPVLLVIFFFCAEVLEISRFKEAARALYPLGSFPLNPQFISGWDLLLLYIDWNILYVLSLLPSCVLLFFLEKPREIRRGLFVAAIPPIVYVMAVLIALFVIALGFVLGMLLSSLIWYHRLVMVIVYSLLLGGLLKKGLFLLADSVTLGYGVNRRRNPNHAGVKPSNFIRKVFTSERLRFRPLRIVAALGISALLVAAVLHVFIRPASFPLAKAVAAINTGKGGLRIFRVSRFGRYVVAGFADGTVGKFGLHDARWLFRKKAMPGGVRSLAISPRGDRIAVGGDYGYLRVIDSGSGALVKAYSRIRYIHNGPVTHLDYGPAGENLISGGMNGQIRIWKPEERRRYSYKYYRGSPPVFISPDMEYILNRNGYASLTLWKASFPSPGKSRYRFKFGRHLFIPKTTMTGPGAWMAMGNRVVVPGNWIAATTGTAGDGGGAVPEKGNRTAGNKKRVPAGKRNVPAADDVIEIKDKTTRTGFAMSNIGIIAAAFHPLGHRIAAAGHTGKIYIWDRESGKLVRSLDGNRSYPTCLAYGRDGKRLAVGYRDGRIVAYVLKEKPVLLATVKHAAALVDVGFLGDGKFLVSGDGRSGFRITPVSVSNTNRSAVK